MLDGMPTESNWDPIHLAGWGLVALVGSTVPVHSTLSGSPGLLGPWWNLIAGCLLLVSGLALLFASIYVAEGDHRPVALSAIGLCLWMLLFVIAAGTRDMYLNILVALLVTLAVALSKTDQKRIFFPVRE